jgi:hypothetical protein
MSFPFMKKALGTGKNAGQAGCYPPTNSLSLSVSKVMKNLRGRRKTA